jgi:lysophospholipase L1-like esterase
VNVRQHTKRFISQAGLVLGGLATALILGEGLAHVFLPAPTPNRLPQVLVMADPECGYRFKPNQSGFTLASPLTINQWGFRGRNWTVVKPPNTVRIAMLGDSYVFGAGVGDDETFAARLERKLNEEALMGVRYEVMNFGVPGYDTGHELKVLEYHAARFAPDIVMLNFFLNDVLYVPDYGFYPKYFSILENSFSIRRFQLRELARRSRLVMAGWDALSGLERTEMTAVSDAYVERNQRPPAGYEKAWKFIADQLDRFRDLTSQQKITPWFVVIPTPQEIESTAAPRAYIDYLIRESQARGIHALDLTEGLRASTKRPRDLLIPYDFHLSNEGHEAAAEILLNAVRQSKPSGF